MALNLLQGRGCSQHQVEETFTEGIGWAEDQGDLGALPWAQPQMSFPARAAPDGGPHPSGPEFEVHPRLVSSKLCEQENLANIPLMRKTLMNLPLLCFHNQTWTFKVI